MLQRLNFVLERGSGSYDHCTVQVTQKRNAQCSYKLGYVHGIIILSKESRAKGCDSLLAGSRPSQSHIEFWICSWDYNLLCRSFGSRRPALILSPNQRILKQIPPTIPKFSDSDKKSPMQTHRAFSFDIL